MYKNLSAKFYQEIKERLQKKFFLKKKKKNNNNRVVKVTKIHQKMIKIN